MSVAQEVPLVENVYRTPPHSEAILDLGFDTIGNATLIVYDRVPILATDPWFQERAYFGGWNLSYEIPEEQLAAIKSARYLWISHGHPDHLHAASLSALGQKRHILLPNHVGGRIYADLLKERYKVEVLPDRKWVNLSPRIRVMCVADYNQDAILLVDVGGKLVLNTNDALNLGNAKLITDLTSCYSNSFLLSLSGYGESDMVNFYDEAGCLVPPPWLEKTPIGQRVAKKTDRLGATYFVPFSCFHRYSRSDNVWLNEYIPSLSEYAEGYTSPRSSILHAFLRYDCTTETPSELNPKPRPQKILTPEECGDCWSDPLEKGDRKNAEHYFRSLPLLAEHLDFINLRVGGIDNEIPFHGGEKFRRGITFEAPRASLMTALQNEIFDDLLIGNFMKTTLHGSWPISRLYPEFCPYVTKYADNGRARTRWQVRAYFLKYELRSFEVLSFRHKAPLMHWFMRSFKRESLTYRLARAVYRLTRI